MDTQIGANRDFANSVIDQASSKPPRNAEAAAKHLYIVWTNADPVTSEHMVFMYATNSMKNAWWDAVTVVVWGAPQTLLCENEAVRAGMEAARAAGVEFSACLTCANLLNTTEPLRAMGLEVIRWGERLSRLLQSGACVLTV